MCLGCQCPQPLPPPNQTIQKCRYMLQILAAALLVIGVIGLACSQIFPFFFNFLLIYMLYMGWTTFNWCMVLAFFMFSTMQTVQSLIVFVGILQYGRFFAKSYVVISVYCLLLIIYYPIAVFVSHYCYKNFKHSFQGNNQLFMGRPAGNNGGAAQQAGGMGGRYQRMVDDRVDNEQPAARRNQPQNDQNNNFFRGQGVRIG